MPDPASDMSSIGALRDALMKSQWPKCNELAAAIAQQGGEEAKEALIAALNSKVHHVRTAAIENLANSGDPSLASLFERFLDDRSYETRIAAKEAIQKLTGRKVLTAKGE